MVLVLAALVLSRLTGCSPPAATSSAVVAASGAPAGAVGADTRLEPVASVQEIMDAEVDPAADALWDSVVSTITLKGEEDKRPHTPEEWQAVRRQALILIEATNLLAMPGRRATPANAAAPAPGELPASEIQKLLEANPAAFVAFAQGLRGAAHQALDAIDAHDADKLMDAGSRIDEACEACHVVFWYPNQVVPKG
jgi:hypothetical protein